MNRQSGARQPAVAGYFYPRDRDELFEAIHRSFTHPLGPGRFPSIKGMARPAPSRVECLIVPHAGYEYSGPIAAHSYEKAAEFFSSWTKSVVAIILGPNHYGVGSGVSVSPSESWQTPLGDAPVNQEISKKLASESGIVDIDEIAHSREHSIEVQVPFLQAVSNLRKDLSIVPICLMLQDKETTEQLADSITKIINSKVESNFLVIGSSDLTHYESQRSANTKDLKLFDSITKLDVVEYYTTLERLNVSACGYGAIATVMNVTRAFGRKKGSLLKYATSGDVTGDKSSVVGYSAVHFI